MFMQEGRTKEGKKRHFRSTNGTVGVIQARKASLREQIKEEFFHDQKLEDGSFPDKLKDDKDYIRLCEQTETINDEFC
jgi:hypothetical protein